MKAKKYNNHLLKHSIIRWEIYLGRISSIVRKVVRYQTGKSEAVNRRRTGNTTGKRKKKDKRKNDDLQNITQKTKYEATQTPLKTGANSDAPQG